MATIFTKIISGELPCHKIAETEDFLAFLDINPNTKGHTLCIPKKEENKIFDLNENEFIELMKFSRKVAKAIKKTIECKRVGMTAIGLEVPHVHVHLIPLNTMDDAQFIKKEQFNSEELKIIAEAISSNI